MQAEDDAAGECASGKSSRQKLDQTVSEQLSYFNDTRKQDAKPMQVVIPSPTGQSKDEDGG
ncbi:hypothetical protein CQ010_03875 [Arthrobacter sp. MYb211]|nr:hypothetical protein CQ017_01975 [Arthrobacter sp. MYb224]PRA06516.1 hypothetical protein CQ019_03805 [Arthrobacter sp. MYb229]PRA12552.1 hypothetical protein CQ015_04655 [Arthrobacter sp. MYb221]PRB53418.1 hypothetical protein CQ013_03805 [Arthrobacter sp. MYb216]PRC09929.1 hypothetical protein CQ010_03875 [Arthrobacter sp. MYb211]